MISKQNVEGMAWFLLTVYIKMQMEKNKLKRELFRKKKEPELEDLENFLPTHIEKQTKKKK